MATTTTTTPTRKNGQRERPPVQLGRRDILAGLRALKRGEFSVRLPDDLDGVDGQICETFNELAQIAESLERELEGLRNGVGREGRTRLRLKRGGRSGGWRNATDSINELLDDVISKGDDVASVLEAIGRGDFSKSIAEEGADTPLRGQFLRHARIVNGLVSQLAQLNSELTRVARQVGVDGKLGAQAQLPAMGGAWRDLTDAVNLMASNLTLQVREIARVTTAVAQGDLTKTINIDARGEILELKNTMNTMIDQLGSFADEVTRVAREVGSEGILGGQARVKGVSGVWRELTENVNRMANNLTAQVRNIAEVSTAIARGDLSRKITVEVKGEILELKNTINTMVDQLRAFADQVTRVAREVGTEGKLGGQASVEGVRGTWKELTDNVNLMASNLTDQVRDIATVTTAVANGDLTRKITVEVRGELLQLKNTVNTMVDQLSAFADEVTRVARDVGLEGKLGGQARVRGVSGIWKELTDNVNLMASNLTNQVRDIANVTTAVANGDLSRKITVEVRGEILELKNTINTMVDQLSAFAAEVTRVAREVGTEGVLGGQAEVPGASGIWKELTDNVNRMATNLTNQVRNISDVARAVANGDLSRTITVDARGEVLDLKATINAMVEQLNAFAAEVTRVARDVGVEGKLGGQADVPGAAGIWRDLTNNVNELAGNLTRQVRAIGDVATAVTKGDLTQSITVDARGEVAQLKDNLNQMIRTLAETTRVNEEQDWLKTNLTRFTRMLQGQRDLLTVARQVLSELAPTVGAQHGVFYMAQVADGKLKLRLFASYGYQERKQVANEFELGSGLVGQAALERKRILITDVPPDYIQISSGLGEAAPLNIALVPVLFEEEVKGVIELASFQPFTKTQLAFLEQLLESLGIVVATIEAQMRTDELLRESQGMAEELQTQQEELQQTNEELEEKARQLTQQKSEVERKNQEVELARQELEEKAEQLALTSRYKSQFLANMSHELRTPLNSLLILSRQLADNRPGNLNEKQVEYARTIYQAGSDLLDLINEILDLAKIESGTMAVDLGPVKFDNLRDYVDRTFRQVGEERGLQFDIELDPQLPDELVTDEMRLKQVLRNLLSNAFKFTEAGTVTLRIFPTGGAPGGAPDIAFAVTDTGIGIPADKQRIIFEAFQQADGGSNRKYGGTGLGLSISREIATLLGGTLAVESEVDRGSTFTLTLPMDYQPRQEPARRSSRQTAPWLVADLAQAPPPAAVAAPAPRAALPSASIPDDRAAIQPGDRVLLVIEDDAAFAAVLRDMAREHGFKVVVAAGGGAGLEFARQLRPHAITLDLRLPDIDGWVVLDQLKHAPETRHIPVHIISARSERRRGLEHGAIAFLEKPVQPEQLRAALTDIQGFLDRQVRRLLVVEDDERQRDAIVSLIGNGDVEITAVATGEEALEALQRDTYDCLVLDLRLPGMSGFDLMKAMKDREDLCRVPVIVYTGMELDESEVTRLRQMAETIIVKNVRSPERLLNETALFLHRVQENLPERARDMLRRGWRPDPLLAGKRVLVVDDDTRNIFAITSVLEDHDMIVTYASDGREALDRIAAGPVDAVLMDIMMPEMDGYEAMRRIRQRPDSAQLPIIALTAKAMKGDREKCIHAGASDYITKPVDPDQLVSLMRVWLYK